MMDALNEIVEWAKVNKPSLYVRYKIEQSDNKHFDKELAEEVVKLLHHNEDGVVISGEKWTFVEATKVAETYGITPDRRYDVYVALNTWYHELGYTSRKIGMSEQDIITTAMHWGFNAEAPQDKVMKYIKVML